MSFFAGVFGLHGELRLNSGLDRLLEDAVGIPPFGRLSRYLGQRLLLYHVDLGVFEEPGYLECDDVVAALAGEPYLPRPGGSPYRRSTDLARLNADCLAEDPALLSEANGTYALCSASLRSGTCLLATDSLGARPLYYYADAEQLYFSTALSVLERLPCIPRRADLRAYLELEAMCYPLGNHSLYADIRVLRDGECLIAGRGSVRRRTYHRWDRVAAAPHPAEEVLARCNEAVRAAVADRVRPGSEHRCLLSGGLDSRCVVALVQELGGRAEAATLAVPGCQDYAYAVQYAAKAGIPIADVAAAAYPVQTTAGATTASLLGTAAGPWRPALVFSGDGGGETLGLLMIKPHVLERLGRGELDRAIAAHLHHPAPPRVLQRGIAATLRDAAAQGMRAELSAICALPADKRLQLFLLRNDMRRHLHAFFERARELGTELLLPFYDRRVIESVLRIPAPLEPYLRHRFYHQWLSLLPSEVREVPWQTYPGDEQCALADQNALADQWDLASRNVRAAGKRWLQASVRQCFGAGFPAYVLRREVVLAAALLHVIGIGCYTHVFRSSLNLHELLARSSSCCADTGP